MPQPAVSGAKGRASASNSAAQKITQLLISPLPSFFNILAQSEKKEKGQGCKLSLNFLLHSLRECPRFSKKLRLPIDLRPSSVV